MTAPKLNKKDQRGLATSARTEKKIESYVAAGRERQRLNAKLHAMHTDLTVDPDEFRAVLAASTKADIDFDMRRRALADAGDVAVIEWGDAFLAAPYA